MTFLDWVPAISTSTVLTIIGFIAGTYYKAKVEKAVQHNFDEKLEALKAQLRRDKEQLKADLRARDDDIEALRSGALSGMAGRQAALDKRRLEAIEKLWSNVIDNWRWKNLAKLARSVNLDLALKVADQRNEEGRKTNEFAAGIWKMAGLTDDDQKPPTDLIAKERPFLSPMTWALFATYRHVINLKTVQVMAMRNGTDPKIFADQQPLLDAVRAALPHYTEYLDEDGVSRLPYLIDDLEEKLFAEIVANLESAAADEKTVTQAAAILKAVQKVSPSTTSEVELPAFPAR